MNSRMEKSRAEWSKEDGKSHAQKGQTPHAESTHPESVALKDRPQKIERRVEAAGVREFDPLNLKLMSY